MTSVKVKKRLMYVTYSFIFLFGGIEYAVILPTLWLYLSEKYDSPEYMLGLVLSAYSVAAFFSAPIFGRLSDRWRRTRPIFLVCLLFEMGGSFLYFIGISQWLCVASRFISGLGAASEGVALAEVSRYTSEEERTRIISYLVAMRQIALLMGPALNLFLRLADFSVGPWEVTKYSAPGIFMVGVWLLLMLVIVTLYTEPKDIHYQEQQETFVNTSHMSSSEGEEAQNQANGSRDDTDEATALLGASRRRHNWSRAGQSQVSENDPYIQRNLTAIDDPIAQEGKLGFFCNEYIRDEIVAILCLFFCAMFSQVCLETMVLPLTKYYLDFGELENSFLYFFSGIEIILVFLLLGRISRCVSDRILIIFGAVVLLMANCWLLYFLPKAPPSDRIANLPMFAVAVVLDMLSMPFLVVCATSLYSKLTRKQTQGLSQGLRRSIVGIGTIMGPLWGSSASTQPYLLIGVLVALQAFSLLLCCLSFPRLKAEQRENTNSIPPTNSSGNHQVAVTPPNPAPTLGYGSSESFGNSIESADWALVRGGACINSHAGDKVRHSASSNSGSTPTTIIYGGGHPRALSATSNTSTLYGSMPRSQTGSSFHSVLSYNSGRASGFASPLV